MNYVNRQGCFNDSMFKELESFAMHQKRFDNFHYTAELKVNGVAKMKVEDLRLVFSVPKDIQLKMRVTELIANTGIMTFNKTDVVTIVITPKAPSKEPATVITVTEWFEDLEGLVDGVEDIPVVKAMPNKWLYLAGTEA